MFGLRIAPFAPRYYAELLGGTSFLDERAANSHAYRRFRALGDFAGEIAAALAEARNPNATYPVIPKTTVSVPRGVFTTWNMDDSSEIKRVEMNYTCIAEPLVNFCGNKQAAEKILRERLQAPVSNASFSDDSGGATG